LTDRRARVVVELRARDAVLLEEPAVAQWPPVRRLSEAELGHAAGDIETLCTAQESLVRIRRVDPEAVELRPPLLRLGLAHIVLAEIDVASDERIGRLRRRIRVDADMEVRSEVVQVAPRIAQRSVAIPVAAAESEQAQHHGTVDLRSFSLPRPRPRD